MEVAIPSSGSLFDQSAPQQPADRYHLEKSFKRRPRSINKPSTEKQSTQSHTLLDGAIAKPKKTKSRKGCWTCKEKRLKCDETHPTCNQCTRRGVKCRGYMPAYQWKSFEERIYTARRGGKKSKTNPVSIHQNVLNIPGTTHDTAKPQDPELDLAFAAAEQAINRDAPKVDTQTPSSHSSVKQDSLDTPRRIALEDRLDPYSVPNSASNESVNSDVSRGSPDPGHIGLLPDFPSPLPPSPRPYLPTAFDGKVGIEDDDFDEEIARDLTLHAEQNDLASWDLRQNSPVPSEASSTSSRSSNITRIIAQPTFGPASPEMLCVRFDSKTCGILSIKDGPGENPWRELIWPLAAKTPALYHALSSMIAFHGASDIQELRVEGVAQMTRSLKHLSTDMHNMRIDGGLATALTLAFSEGWDQHISTGIQHLKGARIMVSNAVTKHQQDLQLNRLTAQDAMTLRFLCNTYMYMDVIARLTSMEEVNNFNLDEIVSIFNPIPPNGALEVDPLMGCAVTLFPTIGRVAGLIQKVRNCPRNSIAIVSNASELREQLLQWQSPHPSRFLRPQDPSSEVQHAIATAEAYRLASLLYLHQAVPELPSEPWEVLAKEVLLRLASVPTTSRTIIVQIFPLLAAGCEVVNEEDRAWVEQRWASMISRLRIGNVNRCLDVLHEVWQRRDLYHAEKQDQASRRLTAHGMFGDDNTPPPLKSRRTLSGESIDTGVFSDRVQGQPPALRRRFTTDATGTAIPEMANGLVSTACSGRLGDVNNDQVDTAFTVRGQLHWIGVMEDHGWEGKSHLASPFVAFGLSLSFVALGRCMEPITDISRRLVFLG